MIRESEILVLEGIVSVALFLAVATVLYVRSFKLDLQAQKIV